MAVILVISSNLLFAEGTREVAPAATDPSTFNTWSTISNTQFAGYDVADEWRLYIHIKDFTQEIIYMGFQKQNAADVIYYRIKDATGTVVFGPKPIPTAGAGYISTHAQAVVGPSAIGGGGGYTEDSYIPTSNGDHYIEFNMNNSTTQEQTEINVDLWDITVADRFLNTATPGRVYSKSWAFNGGSYSAGFFTKFYIYSNDSIVTRLDLNGMIPYRYFANCNSYGAQNTGDFTVDRMSLSTFAHVPEYKIFLNDPDSTVYPTGKISQISSGTPTAVTCGATSCIPVSFSKGGKAQVVLDLNNTGTYETSSVDVLIVQDVTSGLNCLPWDGKDGLGADVPAGTSMPIISTIISGLTNFPVWDAECNPNGFIVDCIRPPNPRPNLFYDDTNIGGAANTVTGCVAPCHQWATGGSCAASSFGDKKLINTYWFSTSSSVAYSMTLNSCPPFAETDLDSTIANTAVVVNVLGNDSDPNDDLDSTTLSLIPALGPSNGTAGSVNTATGEITYTPNGGFIGIDTFSYLICDDVSDCDTGMVIVHVVCANSSGKPEVYGTVFYDYPPVNGTIDPWDPGISGAKVWIYEDVDLDGILDGEDGLIDSVVTDPDGNYSFTSGTAGSTPESISVRVADNDDDAEEYLSGDDIGKVDRGENELEFGQDGDPQIVGMRFTDLRIPVGATITDAYVQFTVESPSSGTVNLNIYGEDVDDAAVFTGSAFNISTRPKTSAVVSWSPPDWSTIGDAGTEQRTPQIRQIVQEIVDRPGWDYRNDMVILIDGSGQSNQRIAESYNGSSAAAPLLFVEFTAPTICVQVNSDDDDADEKLNGSGDMKLDRNELRLGEDGDEWLVGMRFQSINIPLRAQINSASIQFTAKSTDTDPVTVNIYGEDTDDAAVFTATNFDLSSRTPTSATVSWAIPAWNTNDEMGPDQETPDLTGIIQEIVDRPGWSSGNDMVILVDGSGQTEKRKAYPHDDDPNFAPTLCIEFSVFPQAYIFEVDSTSVPTQYSMTTDNLESASFTQAGFSNCKNDFGFSDFVNYWPLPIELLEFEANVVEADVRLEWTTATEIDNDYFIIQRSENTSSWTDIGTVRGAGNSTEVIQYTYLDKNVSPGTWYYRLKQVDFDKSSSFSHYEVVHFYEVMGSPTIEVYPTLLVQNSTLFFKSSATFSSEVQVELFNIEGKPAFNRTFNAYGQKKLQVKSLALAKGIYWGRITDAEHIENFRITVRD